MASLSTCHLGLWLGWQILLNLVLLNIYIDICANSQHISAQKTVLLLLSREYRATPGGGVLSYQRRYFYSCQGSTEQPPGGYFHIKDGTSTLVKGVQSNPGGGGTAIPKTVLLLLSREYRATPGGVLPHQRRYFYSCQGSTEQPRGVLPYQRRYFYSCQGSTEQPRGGTAIPKTVLLLLSREYRATPGGGGTAIPKTVLLLLSREYRAIPWGYCHTKDGTSTLVKGVQSNPGGGTVIPKTVLLLLSREYRATPGGVLPYQRRYFYSCQGSTEQPRGGGTAIPKTVLLLLSREYRATPGGYCHTKDGTSTFVKGVQSNPGGVLPYQRRYFYSCQGSTEQPRGGGGTAIPKTVLLLLSREYRATPGGGGTAIPKTVLLLLSREYRATPGGYCHTKDGTFTLVKGVQSNPVGVLPYQRRYFYSCQGSTEQPRGGYCHTKDGTSTLVKGVQSNPGGGYCHTKDGTSTLVKGVQSNPGGGTAIPKTVLLLLSRVYRATPGGGVLPYQRRYFYSCQGSTEQPRGGGYCHTKDGTSTLVKGVQSNPGGVLSYQRRYFYFCQGSTEQPRGGTAIPKTVLLLLSREYRATPGGGTAIPKTVLLLLSREYKVTPWGYCHTKDGTSTLVKGVQSNPVGVLPYLRRYFYSCQGSTEQPRGGTAIPKTVLLLLSREYRATPGGYCHTKDGTSTLVKGVQSNPGGGTAIPKTVLLLLSREYRAIPWGYCHTKDGTSILVKGVQSNPGGGVLPYQRRYFYSCQGSTEQPRGGVLPYLRRYFYSCQRSTELDDTRLLEEGRMHNFQTSSRVTWDNTAPRDKTAQ